MFIFSEEKGAVSTLDPMIRGLKSEGIPEPLGFFQDVSTLDPMIRGLKFFLAAPRLVRFPVSTLDPMIRGLKLNHYVLAHLSSFAFQP